MSADIIRRWPHQPPERIKRPCDLELESISSALEIQLGTIEAFNRLVDAAHKLKARIDAGDIRSQNPFYAKNIKGLL